jgi:dihydrofolate synthase/folylpolyglutamate synthase
MNYQEALAYLDQLQFFKIKLGLEASERLLAELGKPQDQLKIIHIAGTNGKGSVGANLLSILSAAGYRTGFYSSPHLSSVRERFRIGADYITKTSFAQLVTKLHTFLAGRPTPTYFEFTTILALLWFQEEKADVVILETGMGGRLDATNVVTPLISIITDISRDHEQYLGSTLSEIAGEKAGIIKLKVPVVFSGRAPETVPVIKQRCQEKNSPLYMHDQDFSGHRNSKGALDYRPIHGPLHTDLPLVLAGAHQAINTSLALAALELLESWFPISSQALIDGLHQVHWPCRMELLTLKAQGKTVRFLLDGAHNQAGVEALHLALSQGYPRRRLLLIWGNMIDKQIQPALLELVSLANEIIFTRAESLRSASPAALYEQLPETARVKARCTDTVEQALEEAITAATPDDLTCVAGSLYLVGRMRQLLLGELAA